MAVSRTATPADWPASILAGCSRSGKRVLPLRRRAGATRPEPRGTGRRRRRSKSTMKTSSALRPVTVSLLALLLVLASAASAEKERRRVYRLGDEFEPPVRIVEERDELGVTRRLFERARAEGLKLSPLWIFRGEIDKRGAFHVREVLRGVPAELQPELIAYLEASWRFQPASLDGEPVAVEMYFSWNICFQ